MAIVIPSAESVNTLPVAPTEEQHIVTEALLKVLAQYAQSRILLWATVFILQAIGIP
jgi:hypothetical protein